MDRELNRASLFFRYIREEHEHHREVFERGKREMLESLKNVRVDPNAQPQHAPPPAQEQATAPENIDDQRSGALDSDLKKLYRRIVVETHPDKTDKMGLSQKEIEKRDKAYRRAAAASDKADGDTLIEIAVDLDIETGIDETKVAESLRRRAKVLEDEIHNIKKSVEWFWVHSPDDKKIEIIKEICRRNGWIYITDEQIAESVRRALGIHPGSRDEVMRKAREMAQKRRQIS